MIKKEKLRYLVYLLLVIFSSVFLAAMKKEVSASTGSVTTLRGDKYTKYDITNDGKKDTIQFKKEGESDWYTAYRVYINGKCALTMKNEYYYSADVQMIELSNKKSFLFIHLSGDNDDGPNNIYVYKKGKLVKTVDLIKSADKVMGFHNGATISKVKGNKICINMRSMSYGLAYVEYEAIYKYKADKLVLQSKKHKIIGYTDNKGRTKVGIYTLTSVKSMQLYKEASLKHKSVKLKSGTKMKVKKCYITGKKMSFYVETVNGKKGWFKSPKSATKPFKEIMYAG